MAMAALIHLQLARDRASSPLLDLVASCEAGHPIGDTFYAFVLYNGDLVMLQRTCRHMVRCMGIFFLGDPTWLRIPNNNPVYPDDWETVGEHW